MYNYFCIIIIFIYSTQHEIDIVACHLPQMLRHYLFCLESEYLEWTIETTGKT